MLSQSSLENRLDSFCFWLRVFVAQNQSLGEKRTKISFMQKLLICPIHFQNSKECKKEQEKKKKLTSQFCTLQIPLWKCGLNLKLHSAPIFKSLIFYEPFLFIYITSGFECLWLTKESGKEMGI